MASDSFTLTSFASQGDEARVVLPALLLAQTLFLAVGKLQQRLLLVEELLDVWSMELEEVFIGPLELGEGEVQDALGVASLLVESGARQLYQVDLCLRLVT